MSCVLGPGSRELLSRLQFTAFRSRWEWSFLVPAARASASFCCRMITSACGAQLQVNYVESSQVFCVGLDLGSNRRGGQAQVDAVLDPRMP